MSGVEIEVKFRVADPAALEAKLGQIGFRCITPRTFERNVLYDTRDQAAARAAVDSAHSQIWRTLADDAQMPHG